MVNIMNFFLKFYCGDLKNIYIINELFFKFENLRYFLRSIGFVMFKGFSFV